MEVIRGRERDCRQEIRCEVSVLIWGIMHLTYQPNRTHTGAASTAKAGEAGEPGKLRARDRNLPKRQSLRKVKKNGDAAGVIVGHDLPRRPSKGAGTERPDLLYEFIGGWFREGKSADDLWALGVRRMARTNGQTQGSSFEMWVLLRPNGVVTLYPKHSGGSVVSNLPADSAQSIF
jgi:hypothetical protein